MTTDLHEPIRLSDPPCETGQQYRILEQQGHRISTSRYTCGCALRTGRCRPCHWSSHNTICEPHRELDHALIAIKEGRRYLYVWLYQYRHVAEEIARRYATRHQLVFRVNHPDDDIYCGGATSIRYWVP